MRISRLCGGIVLAFAVALAPARAQDANDGTLHVLRPTINAALEEAEACFEFDRALDPANRARPASVLRLESAGKVLPVKPQNIGISGNTFCLPALRHRREYRITFTGIRGLKGEKLAGPYSLVFAAPDRPPSLAFSGDADAGGLMRWDDSDPVLRSVNVRHVRLELYRVNDPAAMGAAWRMRQQTTLAPSESATFAHDHGQKVWENALVLDETPNRTLESGVPLRASVANLQPGLYLIVARGPEPKTPGGLATTGAAWLLRSGLRLYALRVPGGFYAFAENPGSPAVAKDVRLLVEDANGQALADGKTDADGTGFLPLGADKKYAAVDIIGLAANGDADFADLTARDIGRFALPKGEATISSDRPFYAPDTGVTLKLAAQDAQGHAVVVNNGSVDLLRPDGSFYASYPVTSGDPAGPQDVRSASLLAPALGGVWKLVWHLADGTRLAEAPLRVTSNPDAPHIDMSADRAMLPGDGGVNLTLKSVTADDRPASYVTGRVYIAWASPESIFPEWKDYSFGTGGHPAGDAQPAMSFVTDGKGIANLHLTLTPPDDRALLHSAVVSVRSNPGAGAADPAPLTLPLKPRDEIIGIRALAPGNRFPENGLARFRVVALDGDGHRRKAGDFSWQIYEEGRSFDWFQAEGKWNYKPLPQRRRLGGGSITLDSEGDDIIEWPVTAGTYRLEIADANDAVRASIGFSAGWGRPDAEAMPRNLPLASSMPALQPGQEAQVRFKLDKPSIITAFIGDDRVRKVVHRLAPAGDGSVAFTPDKDWGDRISVRVEADDLGLAGQITLPLPHADAEAKPEAPKPGASKPEADLDLPRLMGAGDTAKVSFAFKAGNEAGNYRYALTAPPGVKLAGPVSGSFPAQSGQWHRVYFSLGALRPGEMNGKLDISGSGLPDQHMTAEWTLAVRTEAFGLAARPAQRLEPQQSWTWPGERPHAGAEDSTLFISAAPLLDTPALLNALLRAHPFTTGEMAKTLEALRLWRDPIVIAGFLSEWELSFRSHDFALRLLARQNPDGSFPVMPGGDPDVVSTAAALTALAQLPAPLAGAATDRAADWLRHRLENTWFDERERPDRAAAYAALAEAGKLDASSLQYFSDTSADKHLPPLAAAQLALAFMKMNNAPAANFWLDQSGVRKAPPAPALLPLLAEDTAYDPQALQPVMEGLSGDLAKNPAPDIETLSAFLRAMANVQSRKGSWRVTVTTDKRNPKDVLVLSVPAKAAPPVIHNTGDGPVFIARTQKAPPHAATESVTRHIYQLNGTEMNAQAPLGPGETYLVVLEGPWPAGEGNDRVLVHDDLEPALTVAGCLPPPPIEADDQLAWLKSQSLSPLVSCEAHKGVTDMLLGKKENAASWRAAYLVKAERGGSFRLKPATAGAFPAGRRESMATRRERVEIR